MSKNDYLIELLKHMEWSDSIIWKTVIGCSDSENDQKIKNILIHYHTVQQRYLSMWEEKPYDLPNQSDLINLNYILQNVIKYYKELNEFRLNIDQYDLDRIVIVPWVDRITKLLGKPPSNSNLTELILQVVVHSSHHRGQVNKRLREIGGEPETIDFIAWVWLGKPEANWKDITFENIK